MREGYSRRRAYRSSSNIVINEGTGFCNEIFTAANTLMPSALIGQPLSEIDFENKTLKYKKYVHQLSNYFRKECELFADVLNFMRTQDPDDFYEIMLSQCLDLDRLEKLLIDFNLMMKKGQRISNRRWQDEVFPIMKKIV